MILDPRIRELWSASGIRNTGGGELRFDGRFVRRDGPFVPPELRRLNPAYLLGTG